MNDTAPPYLVFSTLSGYIAAVAVTGGDVKWISSPCLPQGGCAYRQLWDMKTLPVTTTALFDSNHTITTAASGTGNTSTTGEPLRPLIVSSWIRVTNLDERVATVMEASVRTFTFTPGPGGNYTEANDTAVYDTWHKGNAGVRAPTVTFWSRPALLVP
jgi:hypothetical protein